MGAPANRECHECGRPIRPDQWEDRHTDQDGHDTHADCCRQCAQEVAS